MRLCTCISDARREEGFLIEALEGFNLVVDCKQALRGELWFGSGGCTIAGSTAVVWEVMKHTQ